MCEIGSKMRSITLRKHNNRFQAGLGPRWGNFRRSLGPLVGRGVDTPSHSSPHQYLRVSWSRPDALGFSTSCPLAALSPISILTSLNWHRVFLRGLVTDIVINFPRAYVNALCSAMMRQRSKSIPDVEFQYGGRLFSETGSMLAVYWDISSKCGLQLDFVLLNQGRHQIRNRNRIAMLWLSSWKKSIWLHLGRSDLGEIW